MSLSLSLSLHHTQAIPHAPPCSSSCLAGAALVGPFVPFFVCLSQWAARPLAWECAQGHRHRSAKYMNCTGEFTWNFEPACTRTTKAQSRALCPWGQPHNLLSVTFTHMFHQYWTSIKSQWTNNVIGRELSEIAVRESPSPTCPINTEPVSNRSELMMSLQKEAAEATLLYFTLL